MVAAAFAAVVVVETAFVVAVVVVAVAVAVVAADYNTWQPAGCMHVDWLPVDNQSLLPTLGPQLQRMVVACKADKHRQDSLIEDTVRLAQDLWAVYREQQSL